MHLPFILAECYICTDAGLEHNCHPLDDLFWDNTDWCCSHCYNELDDVAHISETIKASDYVFIGTK